jgi:phage terminase large subunit-like protein
LPNDQLAIIHVRYYFKKIQLVHNHVLGHSPSQTKHMTSHKLKEPGMGEMIDNMHRAGVKHVNIMKVMRETVGGQQNMNMTERDIQNRYSTQKTHNMLEIAESSPVIAVATNNLLVHVC